MSPKVPLLCHLALRCVGPACERERRRPYVCPILSGGRREGGRESASLPPFSHLPVTEMEEDETDDGGVRGRALPRIASSAIYQSTYDVGAPLNAAVVASEAGDGFDDRGVGVAGATFGFFHARTHARARAPALRKTAKIKWSVRSLARSPGGKVACSSLPSSLRILLTR